MRRIDTRSCFTGSESQSYCKKWLNSSLEVHRVTESNQRSHNLFSNSHLGCCSVASTNRTVPSNTTLLACFYFFKQFVASDEFSPTNWFPSKLKDYNRRTAAGFDWFTPPLLCCDRTKVSILRKTWNPDRSVNFRCNHHNHEAHSTLTGHIFPSKADKTVHLNNVHMSFCDEATSYTDAGSTLSKRLHPTENIKQQNNWAGSRRVVPLAQGLLLHLSCLFSQLEPMKPGGQRQL